MGDMVKLETGYYEPQRPGAYGGVSGLSRTTKSKRAPVVKWLSQQDTYTLHKPARRTFPRRRVIVGGIDHQWQADLVDVARLTKHNRGHTFLLTCIDVFSKYAWVVPLKNKTGTSLVAAFEVILKDGRKPLRLQTDKGTEFLNRKFQTWLKQNDIRFFTTHNVETKASVVERFNRTLKSKMWRYFTRHNTRHYLPSLKALTQGYNNSSHRSIKRTPSSVTPVNEEETWLTLYEKNTPIKKPFFDVGDRVRISKTRGKFGKGYLANWSEELFTVHAVRSGLPNVYTLIDDSDTVLAGTFYEQELQRVADKTEYRVEHVLKERTRKGQRQYFVKWYGYPNSFNSWVDRLDVYKN